MPFIFFNDGKSRTFCGMWQDGRPFLLLIAKFHLWKQPRCSLLSWSRWCGSPHWFWPRAAKGTLIIPFCNTDYTQTNYVRVSLEVTQRSSMISPGLRYRTTWLKVQINWRDFWGDVRWDEWLGPEDIIIFSNSHEFATKVNQEQF